MIRAGVKELKNQLSRYLAHVKTGQDVLITERGRVVARFIQEESVKSRTREILQPLVSEGLVTLPSLSIGSDFPDPVELPGKPVSDMVIEDRR
jgi:antitoxin (DNA-binding transcriptional repressor) of toxin-antitoxin stability system